MQSLAGWARKVAASDQARSSVTRLVSQTFCKQSLCDTSASHAWRGFSTLLARPNLPMVHHSRHEVQQLISLRDCLGKELQSLQASAGVRLYSQSCLRASPTVSQPLQRHAANLSMQWTRSKATMAAHGPGVLHAAQHPTQLIDALGKGLSPGARQALTVWLGGCAGWVFSMVVLGGMTRLTRSGLSMTDWKFTGERAPRSQADWEAEFAKYKASPEYQKVNRGMSLDDFKFIYWMEYTHRMWGRVLGLVFAVPAAYFVYRGWVNGALGRRLGLLFAMGATQGFVGWWMVRSGLQEAKNEWETPRVSPYRLAAHLTSAAVIYGTLLWTTLSLAYPLSPAASLPAGSAAQAGVSALRRWAHPLAGLIAVTALSGAFVAGLDAGHAYNTFPLMSGRIIPEEYWAMEGWRNAFENTAAVQLHHRALALSTLGGVMALWAGSRSLQLPRPCRLLVNGMLAMAGLQVVLGISTLLAYVPPSLGTAHQAGALTLLTLALCLLHTLRRNPAQAALRLRTSQMQLGTPAALAAVVAVGTAVTQFS